MHDFNYDDIYRRIKKYYTGYDRYYLLMISTKINFLTYWRSTIDLRFSKLHDFSVVSNMHYLTVQYFICHRMQYISCSILHSNTINTRGYLQSKTQLIVHEFRFSVTSWWTLVQIIICLKLRKFYLLWIYNKYEFNYDILIKTRYMKRNSKV